MEGFAKLVNGVSDTIMQHVKPESIKKNTI